MLSHLKVRAAAMRPFSISPKGSEQMDELKPQYRIFCDEYMTHFNAKKAAIAAGYSVKNACETGHDILQRPEIKMELERMKAARRESNHLEQYQIIQQLQKIAFADLRDFVKWNDDGTCFIDSELVDGDLLTEIDVKSTKVTGADGEETVTTKKKLKLADRMKALELLGKHMSMFNENINHSGKVNVTIIDDIGERNAKTE